MPRPEPKLPFVWGHLEVVEKLGERSLAEVYRAFDPILHRDVALKLMRLPAASTGNTVHLEEARRLARVRHPNVLAVHGVEEHDGRAGLWTDFLRGETLEIRLRRSDPMAAEGLVSIAEDLCRGLAAAHASGIIHGNVKASNVMCEADGRFVLMDFGAVASAGKPHAQAPEQLAGEPPTIASDLYAVGALLYHAATGRAPAGKRTVRRSRTERGSPERPPLTEMRPDLPVELIQAIERALVSAPAGRFRDAMEMGNVLAASLGHPPIGAPHGSAPAREDRLPHREDRFIGREGELATVRRLLVRSAVVTLVGPGGSGKTRLALQAAQEMRTAFPDGALWIDLAPVAEPAGVLVAVARAIGVREARRRALEDLVLEHLGGRAMLLIFDNTEHVREACARLVEAIRARSPMTHLLATGRETLGIAEEESLAVPHLGLPPERSAAGGTAGLEIAESEAVRLFIDRAHRARPGFKLTRGNAPAVAQICRRLDGIPLAIELAAARVKVLDPVEIASRLEESFAILRATGEGALPHQATLDASIAWSERLLSEPERVLLRRLGVFAGRWTLEAAEAACRDAGAERPTIGGVAIQELLQSLSEKSLAAHERAPDAPGRIHEADPSRALRAYRMLEMVRFFARTRLAASGEAVAVHERLLAYCVTLSHDAGAGLLGAEEKRWAQRLDWEHENLLSVLRWVLSAPEHGDEAIRIVVELRRYWYARGLIETGRSTIAWLLTLPSLSPMWRGRALGSLATLLQEQGADEQARSLCEEALVLHRQSGDQLAISGTLTVLAYFYLGRGDAMQAVSLYEEAVEIRRAHGGTPWLAGGICNLGVAYAYAGRLDRAQACYEEAFALFEGLGDMRSTALTAANLAATALDRDDLVAAQSWGDEALRRLSAVGTGLDISGTLSVLAVVALEQGDTVTARARSREALRVRSERRDALDLTRSLAGLACVCAVEGGWETAARLFGTVDEQLEIAKAHLDPGFASRYARYVGLARANLGDGRFEDLLALGRGLTLNQALTIAGAQEEDARAGSE